MTPGPSKTVHPEIPSTSMSTTEPAPAGSTEGACKACGQPGRFACSACGPTVRYCSAECQTRDWPAHSQICPGSRKNSESSKTAGTAAAVASGSTSVGPTTVSPQSTVSRPARVHHAESVPSSIDTTRIPRTSAHRPQGEESGRPSETGQVPLSRASSQSRIRGRGNVAQLINNGWTFPAFIKSLFCRRGQAPTERRPPPDPEVVRFYMIQIYRILRPVILCMMLSIMWVKLTQSYQPYYDNKFAIVSSSNSFFAPGGAGELTTPVLTNSLIVAAIFLSQIIVMTIIVVILFKYGCMKILYGILVVTVALIFGYFGYTLFLALLQSYNLALDWISLGFFLWNLTMVGQVAIFYKAPFRIQQGYLIVMSSLMAYSLSSNPLLGNWAVWILLALLAIWDLIAVLCPFGPLRILVEQSQRQNQPIPALLYNTIIWVMAAPKSPEIHESVPLQDRTPTGPSGADSANPLVTPPTDPEVASIEDDEDDDEEDEQGRGLKLGLGDFVFYSLLVATTALSDWITTMSCFVAVLTGLNMTIFLLALYGKALPALPISIFFGIIFFLASALTMYPFMNELVAVPQVKEGTGLWVGKGDARFVAI